MKFVTGTELLLRRCWQWEEVACQATSIKEHINALTALVVRWRKMEIASWPELLRSVSDVQRHCAKPPPPPLRGVAGARPAHFARHPSDLAIVWLHRTPRPAAARAAASRAQAAASSLPS